MVSYTVAAVLRQLCGEKVAVPAGRAVGFLLADIVHEATRIWSFWAACPIIARFAQLTLPARRVE